MRSNIKTESVKTEIVKTELTKDSTVKTVVKNFDSSGITVTVVYDSAENSNTEATIDIITYPAKSGDYESGFKIKSSIKPKSVQITSHNKKIDERQKEISFTEKKKDIKNTTEKTVNKVKTVDKKKIVFQWWWIALIAAIAVGIYYRKPIKSFIIKIISPLKFLT